MPRVGGSVVCAASAFAVWRLVHDPERLPEWLADTERVEPGADGAVVRYLHGWPDFPMPTEVRSVRDGARVVVSCLVSDIDITVVLTPDDAGCRVALTAVLPEAEAHRSDAMQDLVDASLRRLADRVTAGRDRLG